MIQQIIEDNKSVKKTKSKLCCNQKCMFKLKKQDGSTTSCHQEMMQQIKEFYTTLYSDNVTMPPIDSSARNTIPNVLLSEVRSTIQTLKNGKAAGEDGTNGDILKVTGTHKILADLFSHCLQEERIPTTWKDAKIILLFKNGDKERITGQ